MNAAKDNDPVGTEPWCKIAGIDYLKYLEAVRFIMSKGEAQRKLLIKRLEMNI